MDNQDQTGALVHVRLLRDQSIPCSHCGELFNTGDVVLMPRTTAEGLVRIGDAVIIADQA